MKKLLLILFTFYLTSTIAQTTLSAGDIMFIGVNSDPTGSPLADEFDILFLEPVTNGTEIYFTDMGYTGNVAPYFQQNENNGCPLGDGAFDDGMVKWTANSDITAGTQLVIRVRISSGPISNIGTVSTVVNPEGTNFGMDFSGGGESIHAFQGTINVSNQVTSATMLTSILYDGGGWETDVTTCQTASSVSEDPATGFEVQYITSQFDNGYYSGVMTGTKASLQTAILDIANWTRDNDVSYTLPIPGTFTLGNRTFSLKTNKMYPNPTSNMVYFESKIKKATVYNSLGKIVLETTQNQFTTKSLNSGIYIVKIEGLTANEVSIKKLIKR